jgi:hypothetical protein
MAIAGILSVMSGTRSNQPKQKTPRGEEIPIPTREDVLRNLKKVAKTKPSTPRRPKK